MMKKMKRNEIRKKILGYFNECYEFEYEKVKESDLIEVISVILKKNVKAFRNDLANKIINDFEINVFKEDIEKWKSLKDVIDYIDSKVNEIDEKDKEIREYLRNRYLKKRNEEEIIVMNNRTFEGISQRPTSNDYFTFDADTFQIKFLDKKFYVDDSVPDDIFLRKNGEEILNVVDARPYYKDTM